MTLTAVLVGSVLTAVRPLAIINGVGLVASVVAVVAVARHRAAASLFVLSAAFLALLWFAGSPALQRFRVLQVAAILSFVATAAGVVLAGVRRAPATRAFGWCFLAAAIGVVPEALAGIAADDTAVPTRPEWAGLLAAPLPRAFTGTPSQGESPPMTAHPAVFRSLAGTPDPASSRWVGVAQRDSVLGLVFPADAELKTTYPDNRRDYFEEMDLRAQIWNLVVLPGSSARLDLPARHPGLIRVEVQRANPDTFWTIQLEKAHLAVEPGVPYRLQFRARAGRPRPVSLAFGQAHPPWNGLGLFQELQLAPEWESFGFNFSVPAPDSNARVWFGLARSDAPVELTDVVLLGRGGTPVDQPLAADRYYVTYRFNELGCRGVDQEPSGLPLPRILVLGSAFALGVGVHERDTFAALLQAGAGPDLAPLGEVLNCSVPGYGAREQRLFFQRLAARYDPDVVLLTLGLDANRSDPHRQDGGPAPGQRLGRLFPGWRTILSIWRPVDADYRGVVNEVLAIHRLARSRGAILAVAVLRTGTEDGWSRLADALTRGIPGDSIPLLDSGDALTAARLEGNLIAHPADPHPSEVVHRAAAGLLRPFLGSAAGRAQ